MQRRREPSLLALRRVVLQRDTGSIRYMVGTTGATESAMDLPIGCTDAGPWIPTMTHTAKAGNVVAAMLLTRCVNLDHAEQHPDCVASGDIADAVRYARFLLRTMLEYSIDALCLVHVPELDTVQVCSWRSDEPNHWSQIRPIPARFGRRVLRFLRRRSRGARGSDGSLRVRYSGRHLLLAVASACECDVRIFRTSARPPCAPYAMVFPYHSEDETKPAR